MLFLYLWVLEATEVKSDFFSTLSLIGSLWSSGILTVWDWKVHHCKSVPGIADSVGREKNIIKEFKEKTNNVREVQETAETTNYSFYFLTPL